MMEKRQIESWYKDCLTRKEGQKTVLSASWLQHLPEEENEFAVEIPVTLDQLIVRNRISPEANIIASGAVKRDGSFFVSIIDREKNDAKVFRFLESLSKVSKRHIRDFKMNTYKMFNRYEMILV